MDMWYPGVINVPWTNGDQWCFEAKDFEETKARYAAESTSGPLVRFQHVCTLENFRQWSPEELRLRTLIPKACLPVVVGGVEDGRAHYLARG